MLSDTERMFVDSEIGLLTHMTKPMHAAKGAKATDKYPGVTKEHGALFSK